MSNDIAKTLSEGNVLGFVTGRAKVPREEWDATVAKVWPDFLAEMKTNPGFKGAMSLWTIETGEVSVVGIWSSHETRLAYEAKSAGKVRAIFNALLEQPVRRHKQQISKIYWHG